MKCPHCLVEFHSNASWLYLGKDADGHWAVEKQECPACGRMVVKLANGERSFTSQGTFLGLSVVHQSYLVRPKAAGRPPCHSEVPKDAAEDYKEACLVFGDSPKASAAISRRCLQHLLRDHAKVKPSNLATEIAEFVGQPGVPSHLVEMVDAVRNIGNFAAHPIKATATGEVLPVEPGEAEWNLDVLEALFDFFFVQPAVIKRKRDELNKKLASAGKPPVK